MSDVIDFRARKFARDLRRGIVQIDPAGLVVTFRVGEHRHALDFADARKLGERLMAVTGTVLRKRYQTQAMEQAAGLAEMIERLRAAAKAGEKDADAEAVVAQAAMYGAPGWSHLPRRDRDWWRRWQARKNRSGEGR